MDLRLKTLPFEYGGHTFQLCCNFNVLADLQAAGELEEMLDEKRSFRNFTRLLAALVNEAANAAGLDLSVTDREIGRVVSWKEFRRIQGDVFGLLFAAVLAPDDDEAESTEEETKNVETKEAAATA
nr:MAG TPA: tail tube protein [Caudoviricetes sp.]